MKNYINILNLSLLLFINYIGFSQIVGDYSLLIVNGNFATDAQTELTAMGHSVIIDNAINLTMGYDYSPYDAIIFMYDSPSPTGLSEIIALNESCQLGIILLRGENVITPVELGNSVFWSSTDFTIQNNSHWITSVFATGVLDLGFTYKSNVTSAMPNSTILGSVETGNGSLVVHNDYKRVVSPYYGHTAGMPWTTEGEILMDRIIAWAVAPCCANTTNNLSVSTCFTYTVPSGDETYTFSGTQTVMDTIPNLCGADSVLTISLTLNQLDLNVTQSGFVLSSDMTGASYQWINCNTLTPISGATNQSFAPAADGDYAVVVTQSGCSDTSICYTIQGLALEENALSPIVLFPNPAANAITIQSADFIESISIYNMAGELMLTENQKIISVENLQSGIYLAIVKTENGTSQIRFVKH